TRAVRHRDLPDHRRGARHPRRHLPGPVAGPHHPGDQPRRGIDADLLDRPGGVLPAVLPARLAARRGPAGPGRISPGAYHRPVHRGRAAARAMGTAVVGAAPPSAARPRPGHLHRRHAHPLHPCLDAGDHGQRLRTRCSPQGAARACRDLAARATPRTDLDHYRGRAGIRRPAVRNRAGREHLRLAGPRPVRLPQRRQSRPARDHGRVAVHRAGLHRDQPGHRPADPAVMNGSPVLPAAPPGLADDVLARRRRRLRVPPAWRQPLAVTGLAVVGAWLVIAIFAPLIGPDNPLAQNFGILAAPSSAHWFGTDELGRDVLSRVLSGARVTLPLSVLLVVIAMLIGAVLGGFAGFLGGWADVALMRLADLFFAFPGIILALAVAAALGPQ